jgi:hypothetical protein
VVNLKRRWVIVDAFFKLIAAGPLFFGQLAAWLARIRAGAASANAS